jgi:hypothetical protein
MLPKLYNTKIGMDYVTLKNLFLLHQFSSCNCIFRYYMSWMTNFASEWYLISFLHIWSMA